MKISKPKELNLFERILRAAYLVYCRCRFGHDIRMIPLTRYKFAIVDADNYDRLKNFNSPNLFEKQQGLLVYKYCDLYNT
jgi:hypothetical protein